ncbi:flavin reductase family protein [Okibacterium endophyticum]
MAQTTDADAFPRRFRQVLSHFASGVVVVTAQGDRPVGITCQSFFSVSLEPPLIAISPSVHSASWKAIAETGSFAVNVLDADQEALCLAFGRAGVPDKFAGVEWTPAPSGSPLLAGAIAWLDCDIEAVHPAGDHLIVLGRVRTLELAEHGKPLVFYKSRFGKLSPTPLRHTEWNDELIWGGGPWFGGDS